MENHLQHSQKPQFAFQSMKTQQLYHVLQSLSNKPKIHHSSPIDQDEIKLNNHTKNQSKTPKAVTPKAKYVKPWTVEPSKPQSYSKKHEKKLCCTYRGEKQAQSFQDPITVAEFNSSLYFSKGSLDKSIETKRNKKRYDDKPKSKLFTKDQLKSIQRSLQFVNIHQSQ